MEEKDYSAHTAEVLNCAQSFEYFCEKYLKVNHPKHGQTEFKLYNFQKNYIDHITANRFSICKKFRQGGFTTLTIAWFLWRCMFKSGSYFVGSKTDREAIHTGDTFKQLIDNLPDWLKPRLKKQNCHETVFEDTGSSILFSTFVACCGRSLDYMLVDEAAYVRDMEKNWKALAPCLCNHGRAIVLSTPNGKKNWFYETYTDAEVGNNLFHPFIVSYTEHPDYNNEEWVKQTKENLGELNWRQEVECEFFDRDEEKAKMAFKPAPKFDDLYYANSEREEKQILWQCKQKAILEGKNTQHVQLGNIKDNNEPPHLSEGGAEAAKVSFDHVLRPTSFRSYCWSDVAEEIGEEVFGVFNDSSILDCVEEKKENLRRLMERSGEDQFEDLLVLSDVSTSEESDNQCWRSDKSPIDQKVLKRVKELGDFPKELILSFSDKHFCINGVKTNIKEFDLICLFHGISAFSSEAKAVEKVAKLICKKMTPLFGVSKRA